MGQFQELWKCQSEEVGDPRNLWKQFKIGAIYLKDCDFKCKGKKKEGRFLYYQSFDI